MKTFPIRLIVLLMMAGTASAQTYMPITDNMDIQSNANIKFAGGNYTFNDAALDGVVRIDGKNNIILDGDSCFVGGTNYAGYFIKITNSHNIILKNFDSVFSFKYAVHIMNSDHIVINGNTFSRNKVDSSGWIDVWADYNQALGGGVMMYQSRAADIYDNVMKFQNDGVALYHCDSIRIHDNDFAWNTSYGIRMFWTDSCHIYNNVVNHINRPFTDPSDCAALLMIVSNENKVEYNDLSWSGDGVFLGQYQHSATPNNNYFAWNECSYSPHNAIEATFADGNIYKHNKCNVSHYGFWLGYSFNSIVDSNEINGNFNSGIAIDRGFNNYIAHNEIMNNPIGIELWEGSPIGGYTNQFSHDYEIFYNTIEGNTTGIDADKTENMNIHGNEFLYNQAYSIYFTGLSSGDTLSENDFRSPTGFHVYNNSVNDIYTMLCAWTPYDSLFIEDKIYDKHDMTSKGQVLWSDHLPGPPAAIQYDSPCDMAEPGSIWYAYPEIGYPGPRIPDAVSFDSTEKKVGAASVKLVSGRGWYDALNYRPGADSMARWELTEADTLYYWVRTVKQQPYGFQYFHIRVGDHMGNYYKYTGAVSLLNAAHLNWKRYKVPLSGGSGYTRSTVGNMSLDNVNYVEFDADTWDYGFTLWVDGVQFAQCDPVLRITNNEGRKTNSFVVYPNPARSYLVARFELSEKEHFIIRIHDAQGRTVKTLYEGDAGPGESDILCTLDHMKPGFYTIQLKTETTTTTQKLIIH